MTLSLEKVAETFMDDASAAYTDLSDGRRDYDAVRKSLEYLSEHWKERPQLDVVAEHVGLSPSHFQKLFKRWAGLSPKEFLQAITLDHARDMLRGSASLLEISDVLGLSGPARLHDLFVTYEAMSPGEYKRLGGGLKIRYGFHDCPFGIALVMLTDRGICGLGFCDDEDAQNSLFVDMKERWPEAEYIASNQETKPVIHRIFSTAEADTSQPIKIILIGSDFEIKVWESLLKVPAGRAITYSDLSEHIGSSGAHRAVGSAVGRNPISLVVPCHRVLRKDASLGGYHWGLTRKQAIIGWEAGKLRAEMED